MFTRATGRYRQWVMGLGCMLAIVAGAGASATPAAAQTVCPASGVATAPVTPALAILTEIYVGQTVTLYPNPCGPIVGGGGGTITGTVAWQESLDGGLTWVYITGGAPGGALPFTPQSPGTYAFRSVVTDSTGTTTSPPTTITVLAVPTVANVSASPGTNAILSLVGALVPGSTEQWQTSTDGGTTWAPDTTDAGATSTSLTIAAVTAAQNGELYRVAITDAEGTVYTPPATLSVAGGSAPVVTQNPANATSGTCGFRTPAVFTAAASGVPAPTVQWQVLAPGSVTWADDTTDAGATTDTLTVAPPTVAQSGTQYRAVFTNGNGTATTSAATLTVLAPPPVVPPAPVTVDVGATATFQVGITCAGEGVQWQVSTDGGATWTNDTSDAGATTATLTVASVTVSENGNLYRAVVTSPTGPSGGMVTTPGALLSVLYPPVVTTQPTNVTAVAGQSVSLTAAADGGARPTVQWQVSTDGGTTWTNIPGATSPTLNVSAVASCVPYEYRALFTNELGSVATNAVSVTVNVPPVVTQQPTSVSVLAGQSATFAVAAQICPASSSVQWQVSTDGGAVWSNDTADVGTTTPTLTIPAVTLAQNGNEYRAVFSNAVGSVTSAAATLTVRAANQPVVSSVSPSSGASFSLVLISGSNLSGATSVTFGAGHRAFFLVLSSKLIIALAPSESAGKVDVTVTTKAGTSATSSADQFTYR